jgi:protein gp37
MQKKGAPMQGTKIAWTESTFNIAWGCTKVSPGCKHCYADTLSQRYTGSRFWGPGAERRTFGAKHWADPLKWNEIARQRRQRMRVFTSSMCDVFEDHPTIDGERLRLWDLIIGTPWLDWQILTKRAERIADHLPRTWAAGWPNVWLGVSIESPEYLWRMETLKQIPAQVRFLSLEPLLADLGSLDLAGIQWVIVGGESGPGYRAMEHAWGRRVRDACIEQNVSFFFKQSAAARTEMGTALQEEDGSIWEWRQYPGHLSPPVQRYIPPVRHGRA